jgi:hypothetical protein
MFQKTVVGFLAACMCFLLAGCLDKDSGKVDEEIFDIKLPQGLTEETADLIVTDLSGRKILLNLAILRELPAVEFVTYDPWDEKRERFSGVSLLGLLRSLEVVMDADSIMVIAGNGYEIPIKMTDLKRYEYILAYMIDGQMLQETEHMVKKGKLIIAINFGKHPDIPVEVYKNQLVWQVRQIALDRN